MAINAMINYTATKQRAHNIPSSAICTDCPKPWLYLLHYRKSRFGIANDGGPMMFNLGIDTDLMQFSF
jgi:hypothetical protein